jgi:hypothetical protein
VYLFFRVARSLRPPRRMLVARGLKNSQLIRRLPVGVNLTGRNQDCTGR